MGGWASGTPCPFPALSWHLPGLQALRPTCLEGPTHPPAAHPIWPSADTVSRYGHMPRGIKLSPPRQLGGQSHTARDRNQGEKSKETPTEAMKGESKAKPDERQACVQLNRRTESRQEAGLFPWPQRGPYTWPVPTAQQPLSTKGTPRSHCPGRALCMPRPSKTGRGNVTVVMLPQATQGRVTHEAKNVADTH